MKSSALVPLGALLLLAAVGSCREPEADRPMNLLLISVDTLRADHLHCYGYDRKTTPNLDALAGSGVRFDRAWAHSPWTLPSHATMLSGTHPFYHGTVDDGTILGPSLPLLAPILRSRGYATAAVVSGFYVSSRFGFDRGFDRFEDFGLAQEARPRDSVRAGEVTERALRLIAESRDEPFFLFAHYFDPHNTYGAPEPWDQVFDADPSGVPKRSYEYYKSRPLEPHVLAHVVAQYDEEILYTDAMIGELLAALERAGRLENTLIIVTSDHGEEFFEHVSWGHGHSLYSEVLRVPLILAGPGLRRGHVSEQLVRHVDLAPTVLDLLSLPPDPGFQGESYAALARAGGAPELQGEGRVLVSETSRHRENFIGTVSQARSLVVDLAGERAELYDLAADPGERTDLALSRPSEVAELLQKVLRGLPTLVPDRWVVSWRGGAKGQATIDGILLGDPAPAAAAGSVGAAIARLKRAEFRAPAGEVRLVAIPPDAPIEFVVDCGVRGGDCISGGDPPAPRAASASSVRPGPIRSRLDPVADGGRLRRAANSSVPTAGSSPFFRVGIESRHPAPAASSLTDEELERLKSLGYIH